MMTNLIRMPDVKAKTGLPKTTIYEMIAAGDFPKQVALGDRTVGWVCSEIEEWVRERIRRSREPNSSQLYGN